MPPAPDTQPPAAVACQAYGSYSRLAEALELHPSTVWRWLRTGLVPAEYHVRLLADAAQRGYQLTEHDLIHGRSTHARKR